MKFRIVNNAWWMFWAVGMVVWPWVWFKKGRLEVDRIYRHELQHCYQVQKLGRVKFYFTYIVKWLRHGYRNHPYEVEARRYQHMPLTPEEEHWRATKKIVLQ